jgi:hypothetical protein
MQTTGRVDGEDMRVTSPRDQDWRLVTDLRECMYSAILPSMFGWNASKWTSMTVTPGEREKDLIMLHQSSLIARSQSSFSLRTIDLDV